jgi:hypothetical protein
LNYTDKGIRKMRIWSIILILAVAAAASACGSSDPVSPKKTFETYIKALKAKDTTTMKVLLSDGTMKMHEQEAKAQGITVDDIVKRETLFSEGQTKVEYKDEKIDGNKATLRVKTPYATWETVPFVLEDGQWKIDKQGYANQMLQEMDESNRRLDEMINGNVQPPFDGSQAPTKLGNSSQPQY